MVQVRADPADDTGMRPPDELPRSPSGRVPAWVAEEQAAFAAPPPAWRAAESSGPPGVPSRTGLRRRTWVVLIALGAGLAVALWLASGAPGVNGPDVLVQEPPPAAPTGAPATSAPPTEPTPAPEPPPPPEPSAEVAALADAAHLSAEGRRLFFGADPQVLGAEEFRGRCDHGGTAVRADGTAVGCFRQDASGTSIVLYRPVDTRLHGFVVEAAAHETLHAAWEELDPGTQETMTTLLEAVVAGLPADDAIHRQIAGSVGDRPQNRPTELFAYVGTQVWADGGLPPDVEAVYRRYVEDRAALVAVHRSWQALLDGMDAEIRSRSDAVVARQREVAQRRAQHAADTAAVATYRGTYTEKLAEVEAMDAAERDRLRLGWTWWDGTELPMQPAGELLAAVADLLARDETELAAREVVLGADEAAVAQERADVEALIEDLRMLHAQLDPSAPSR